jgi:uncharacterized membrane protein YdjX (TVP38/TMEM64 family)
LLFRHGVSVVDTGSVRRLGALLFVVGVAAAIAVTGLGDRLGDVESVETFLRDRGWVGPVVFVLVMWGLQPLGVPGVVFMVPAAVVWPAPVAMALSWIGNMGASFIAFAFARWVAREWAQARLPGRVRRWDARLAAGRVSDIVLLRVVTGQLTPADWLLGISSVRVRPFLIGTGVGIIPVIVIVVVAGASVGGWLFAEPVRWGSAVAVVVAGALAGRVRTRNLR